MDDDICIFKFFSFYQTIFVYYFDILTIHIWLNLIEFDVVSKIDEHNEVEYADGITLRKYEG